MLDRFSAGKSPKTARRNWGIVFFFLFFYRTNGFNKQHERLRCSPPIFSKQKAAANIAGAWRASSPSCAAARLRWLGPTSPFFRFFGCLKHNWNKQKYGESQCCLNFTTDGCMLYLEICFFDFWWRNVWWSQPNWSERTIFQSKLQNRKQCHIWPFRHPEKKGFYNVFIFFPWGKVVVVRWGVHDLHREAKDVPDVAEMDLDWRKLNIWSSGQFQVVLSKMVRHQGFIQRLNWSEIWLEFLFGSLVDQLEMKYEQIESSWFPTRWHDAIDFFLSYHPKGMCLRRLRDKISAKRHCSPVGACGPWKQGYKTPRSSKPFTIHDHTVPNRSKSTIVWHWSFPAEGWRQANINQDVILTCFNRLSDPVSNSPSFSTSYFPCISSLPMG